VKREVLKYLHENQILAAILILALAWLVIEVREVLVALFVSYILMAAISPYADYLKRHKFPGPIAVIIPYIGALIVLFLIVISLLPFFISQIQLLLLLLPTYLNQEISFFGAVIDSSEFSKLAANELSSIGGNAIAFTSRVFGGVVSAISILAISFYLLLYRDTVTRSFVNLFPKNSQEKIAKTTKLVEDKLGSWLRGQIVLSASIGILTWVVLTILGVEFALPLAVIAGILEIVPTIGPILSAIPAILVALSISPVLALIVAISYFFIQLFENNILVPRIMQRAVGLNPIVIIISIIVGGKLLGITGALLAIPFVSLLVVVYKNLE
jgi:predicted PurR-regulated permease PerM